jgi:hypothetical protein
LPEQIEKFIDRTSAHRASLVGEAILYDVIIKKAQFTDDKVKKLENMYASRLAQIANKKHNESTLQYKELLLEAASDMYTEIVLSFNVLLAGVIGPEEFLTFAFGPTSYIDLHLLDLPSLIEKKLKLLTSVGVNEGSLAKAFIRLIKFALGKEVASEV